MSFQAIEGLATSLLLLICTACGPSLATHATTASAPANTLAATVPVDPSLTPNVPATSTSTPEPPLAALVNGQPIYLADFERTLAQYEASLPELGIDPNSPEGQAKQAQAPAHVLNVMIEQVLTEQAAVVAGIVIADADVDAFMQEMIAESGGEEAFRARLAERGEAYEEAWQQVRMQLIGMAMTEHVIAGVPTTAEHVHVRHILVDTSEEAQRLLAQLRAGADFVVLATAYSQDPNTREVGGDLDWFPQGTLTVPEVEEAAFALQPGQFSDVVASPLGYHIVQVIERDPNRPISQNNLELLWERELQGWIEELWAQAEVQRFIETSP
jgi:parvulin-like peptidyl-prolyl isomerase